MRIKKAEEYVETLTREQLLALTDRVIRAVADRGYFGDKVALDEIFRLVSGSDQRETLSIKMGDRLFQKDQEYISAMTGSDYSFSEEGGPYEDA